MAEGTGAVEPGRGLCPLPPTKGPSTAGAQTGFCPSISSLFHGLNNPKNCMCTWPRTQLNPNN